MRKKKIKILNLGCGKRKFFSGDDAVSKIIKKEMNIVDKTEVEEVGVDIIPDSVADIIHDLNQFPYPFKDDEFDNIVTVHVIEHLWDTLKVLNELHRICKKGGKIYIRVPHKSGNAAWGNPDHKKCFSSAIRIFIDSDLRDKFSVEKLKMHYVSIYGYSESKVKRFLSWLIDTFANLNVRFCDRVWCYWVGGFNEIYFVLNVHK